MTDDLLRFRADFPILERTTYMISNSLGAMPRGVYDSVHSFCDTWASRGVRAWEETVVDDGAGSGRCHWRAHECGARFGKPSP